jgi:hypothetical protein
MATTTPNFGWVVPTSTDLVKDGATAIETLGDSIDASMAELKGGTTGQVLSKTSNTDMDFTWVAQDDSNAIQNAIVTAKGDLIGATASATPARLGVGTNGQVLTADSTAATGIKWATAAGGSGRILQTVSTTTSSLASIASTTMTDTNLSLSITPTSATSKILVIVNQAWKVERLSTDAGHAMRIMRDATQIYTTLGAAGATNSAGMLFVSGQTNMQVGGIIALTYLDSPATTSAITYKTQGRTEKTTNSGTVYYQGNDALSIITLMEIGA